MKSPCIVFAIVFGVLTCACCGEESKPVWKLQKTGVEASLRGLCVVDANVVWASGAAGTVILTTNAGNEWHDVSIEVASELDFRDVQAFDEKNAVVLSAGQPARVYQTADGGETWKQRYEHPNKASFFDSISFFDRQRGIAMSDPIDGHVLLIATNDGGKTWSERPMKKRPKSMPGEAGFAASGTNMCIAQDRVFIALGGGEEGQVESASRIVYSLEGSGAWNSAHVPIPRGASSGIFSIAFADAVNGIAVGGDYRQEAKPSGNVAITTDGGKTWEQPAGNRPHGFRSCVANRKAADRLSWVAVGPNGTDYSIDGGQSWLPASDIGFHAVQFSADASSGFASGTDGRVAIWIGK